jgi:hypothetical protein
MINRGKLALAHKLCEREATAQGKCATRMFRAVASPRQVELPENFTFAAMAEVRSLPRPHASSAPAYAYHVSNLVAAWLLIGAGFLLANFLHTVGLIGHVGARVVGDFGALATLLVGAIVLDVAVALALIVGLAIVRPRPAERPRRERPPRHAVRGPLRGRRLGPGGSGQGARPDGGETQAFTDVYVVPDQTIDGDANVVFGDAKVAGVVRGDCNTVFGQCTLVDGGQVLGQINSITGDGVRTFAPWAVDGYGFGALVEQDHGLFVKLLSSAVVVLVFLLSPLRMCVALDRVEPHPSLSAATRAVAAP